MNKKLKKLFNNPRAYFYDYFRKQIRHQPKGIVSLAVKVAFANAKTDLGYDKEIRSCLRTNDLDRAENICIEGMGVVPKAIRPHVLYAEISMRRQDFNEAKERWKSVVDKFPNMAEGYAGEARAYAALGDFENDEKLCRSCIERMPQEIWPYVELAEISMRQEDFNEAIKRWSTVKEKFPDKAPGYVRASVAYCNLKKFSDAEELCRQCMKIAPNDIRSFAEYAEISMRQKNFDEALKRWQTLRDRFPKRAVGYVRAAAAYSEIEEYLKAEDLCRISMEVEPKDIRSFAEYAEISMRKGDFKEASNRWEIVRDKFPHRINGYIGGGRAYMELLEYTKAEDLCTQGLNAMEGQPARCRDLYYLLINITLPQHGRAQDCIKYVSSIEQTRRGIITDRRYYIALANILFVMLGKDKADINGQDSEFIIVRLLNEPINKTKENISLGITIDRITRLSKETTEKLKGFIDQVINTNHIINPLAVLVSSLSSDEDRVDAFLKIIRDNCCHSEQLCVYQPKNSIMLEKACDVITESGEWRSFNPYKLFNFARTVIFADQDKGDELISQIYDVHKNQSLPISDPIGLLCYRHKKRQDYIMHISKSPLSDDKKLNIAVCISGQLRGYKGNIESLVNSFGLDKHNYRVFVHTWNNIGRKFPLAAHASRVFSGEFLKTYYEAFSNTPNLQDYLQRLYPNFYRLITNSSLATYDDLKDEYKTTDIVIDNEDSEPFSTWNNQEKMHYKIYASNKLAIDCGEKFDLVIRIRPDMRRESEKPLDLTEIYNKSLSNYSVHTFGGLVGVHWYKEFLINDMFAIGITEAMNIYSNSYKDFNWHIQNHTFSRTNKLFGHTTLEHNLFCNGVHVEKIVHKFTGSLRDPERLSIEDIYTVLKTDVKDREIKSQDQILLDACKKDLGLLK